ncbi:MAG: hypothetical protein WC350_05905 [Candidatus Micrarchaeia archaeon]
MSRNKNLVIFAVVLLVLTLFGEDVYNSISGGGDTLTLQNGNYQSSDPFFNGPVQVLNIVVNGAGNSWSGTLTPDLIGSITGHRPSGAYDLRVERLEETCEYTINSEAIPLNMYTVFNAPLVKSCSQSPTGTTWFTGSSCSYVGRSGGIITRTWTDSSGTGCNYHATCSFVTANRAATGYYLDPTTTYYNKIKVTFTAGGKDYEIILDPNNLEGSIPEVVRVKFLGSFMGQQSCPSMSSNYMAYRSANTNQLELRNKFTVEQARSQCMAVNANNYLSCNSAVNTAASEAPMSMFSCQVIDWAGEGTSAKIKCRPSSPVTIPLLQVTIPDSTPVVTHVPVGVPEILEAKAGNVEAADFSQVLVKVKNSGEDASFDVALDCGRLSPTSKRINLMAGETQVVSIPYNGAGLIEKCTVEMTDVNKAENRDQMEVTINIAPFCDRSQPSPAHVLAYTREYGCWWVCPNQHTDNIFESDCAAIDYPQVEAGNESQNDYLDSMRAQYRGFAHCTQEGKYVSVSSYLQDGTEFIPQERAHKVWLGAPVCKYADEYGYENGVAITDNYQFIYGVMPNVGASEEPSFTAPQLPGSSPLGNVYVPLPSVENVDNTVRETTGQPLWLVAALLVVIAAVGYYVWRRG